MKIVRRPIIIGLLLIAGLFVALHFARAQATDTGVGVMTDPDTDVSDLSDLAVELKALEMATPLAASNAPASGNFYSAQHAPGSASSWPPLPANLMRFYFWPLDSNIFVLDDLNFDYSDAPAKTSVTANSMMVQADVAGPPTPGGGGGSTNTYNPTPLVSDLPDYGTNLYVVSLGMVSGSLTGVASNTLADVEYAVQTNSDLTTSNWVDTGQFILGSDATNWTQFILPPPLSTNNLFYRLQSELSSDDSGLPNWWELKYLGTTSGINPNAQDSAGDGYTIYQKYEMGLNPNTFYTPLAPQGVNVTYDSTTGTVTITWLPSSGDVTGYTVTDANGHAYNVTGDSFTENVPYSPDFDFSYGNPTMQGSFQVQANYASGNSAQSASVSLQPSTVFGSIIPGPAGGNLLAVANIPANAAYVRVFMYYSGVYINSDEYTIITNVDVPVTDFTNGFCPAYSSWLTLPAFQSALGSENHYFYLQSVDTNGNVSGGSQLIENWGPDNFYDGREQLKQNLTFQFRVADTISPFGFISFTNYPYVNAPGTTTHVSNPVGYAYAAFYDDRNYNAMYGTALDVPTFDIYRPFADNVLYRNFVYTSSDVDANGNMTTGVQLSYSLDDGTNLDLSLLPTYLPTTNTVSAPLLGSAEYLCTYSAGIIGVDYAHDFGCEGFSYNNDGNGDLDFTNNIPNYWGLMFTSAEVYYVDGNTGDNENTILNAGGSLSYIGVNAIYMNTTTPKYRTVDYDFWNDNFYEASPEDGGYEIFSDTEGTTNLPGNSAFSTTNTSQLLMVGVGQSIGIAAFAKLEVTNSIYSGVYGYVQQYLTNAYALDDSGNVTTNLTGIVSPYGNYFATQAGAAAVVTMPDPDTGQQGTGMVYAVSLNVDKNHDGTMDLSWNGPDATSASSPFVFWANNNYDRYVLDSDDNTFYDDDVQVQDSPGTPNQATPDCNYLNAAGQRVISCARDLQDFARLWICGITTNLLTNLPAGSTVTLNWGDVGNPNSSNPTIDLFPAADSDGGIGYLTNSIAAENQLDFSLYPYIGRIGPGSNLVLNASQFANNWAGNHFIWCGVGDGTGELNLTIADADGNILAQTTAYIEIVDIAQMFERWTVGDQTGVAPLTNALPASENLPVGISAFRYEPPMDTNNPYILYVHGWNMEQWDKDRFAESAFKRLYWQGYQGRFGSFRWPTYNGFTGSFWQTLTDPRNYDNSELVAWQSSTGLVNKLTDLNGIYPGHVYVLAHSMGNVVTGGALRLAGNNQIVNTYIASQAAVPAHDYDETITTPYLLQFTYTYPSGALSYLGSQNYGPSTPNIYGNWLTTNSAAVGRRINFYNTNDFALAAPRWCFDQITKPDYIPPNNYYYYSGSLTDPAPWNHFYDSPILGGDGVLVDIVTNLNNRYTIMAYAAEPRSTALGATPSVGNLTGNLNLISVWPTDETGGDYTEHFYHSAQFRGDCWQEWNYWNTLLFSTQYGFRISNP